MTPTYLHLLVNHFPLVSLFFSTIFFIVGWKINNNTLKCTSLSLILFSGITTVPTSLSGEEAEDSLSHRTEISKELIHDHEEAAEITVWFVYANAILAAISLWVFFKKKTFFPWALKISFLLCLISLALLARTNKLGGKIIHHELQNSPDG